MRRWLTLALGVLIGQWLAFAGSESPARVQRLAFAAFDRQDYLEAARLWSRAVSRQPDNASFHYFLASSLAHLGHRQSAADAYQVALMLEPPKDVARLAREGLSDLGAAASHTGPSGEGRTSVGVESSRGVWVVPVTLNGGAAHGRFLLDTGASVTLVAPALARSLGISGAAFRSPVAIDTIGGRTAGPSATMVSIRVGDAEARDVPVVIHDPGPGVDGILGNTFLDQFELTLNVDRRLLVLRRFGAG